MREAVRNAQGVTQAISASLKPAPAASPAPAALAPAMASPLAAPPAARKPMADQLQLVHELMRGVEQRFGIKSGTLVERKLTRILTRPTSAATRTCWTWSRRRSCRC